MTTPAEVLIAARKLIERPENWTQGAFARDAKSHPETALSRHATCWCSAGAIIRVAPNQYTTQSHCFDLLCPATTQTLAQFNDTHTHAEVLAAFDAAIELAQKEQQP